MLEKKDERRRGSTPIHIGSGNRHWRISNIEQVRSRLNRLVLAESSLEPALSLGVVAHFRVIRGLAQMATVGCGGTAAHRPSSIGISCWRLAAKVDPAASTSLVVQIWSTSESLKPVAFSNLLLLLLLLLLQLVDGAVHRARVSRIAVSVGIAARARARRCGHVVIRFVIAVLRISALIGVHSCVVAWSRSAAAALVVRVIVLRVAVAIAILDIAVRSRIGPAAIVMTALVVVTPVGMAVGSCIKYPSQ